jgi:hypothetical protein
VLRCLHDICEGRTAIRGPEDLEVIFNCLWERKMLKVVQGKLRLDKGGYRNEMERKTIRGPSAGHPGRGYPNPSGYGNY